MKIFIFVKNYKTMKKLIFGLVFVFLISYFPGINLASASIIPKTEIQKRKLPSKPPKPPKSRKPRKPRPSHRSKAPAKRPWRK